MNRSYEYFFHRLLLQILGLGLVSFQCLMVNQPLWVIYAKTILIKEQQLYNLIHSWEDKGVHTFLKRIKPKINLIVRLEFELAYYDIVVQHVNHYATGPQAT